MTAAAAIQAAFRQALTIIGAPEPLAPLQPLSWIEKNLKILDKEKRLIPLSPNRAQRHYMEHRSRRNLILKARQLGLSTIEQATMFQKVATSTVSTITLAHDQETTQLLRRMTERYWDNMPESIRPRRKYANTKLSTYPDTGSESMIATAGNEKAGRGGTYSHMHGSEVGYWDDAEGLVSGVMQGGNPIVTLESTPNGAQGYFYELCMAALNKENDWTLHFYPWWWEEGYQIALNEGETLSYTDTEQALIGEHVLSAAQIKWRRLKQRELPNTFLQEYPEDPITCFLRSGYGFFGDLSGVFDVPSGSPGYDPAHRYVAGLDFGQSEDFTVLHVLDTIALAQVDMLRINQLPWLEMRKQIVGMCKKWHIATLVAEKNSMGGTNIEALTAELRSAGGDTVVHPFDTNNASKQRIMSDLNTALHEGGLRLLKHDAQQHEFAAFVAKQTISGTWQLAAKGNEHDDTVIAAALAWYAYVFGTVPIFSVAESKPDPDLARHESIKMDDAAEFARLIKEMYKNDSQ